MVDGVSQAAEGIAADPVACCADDEQIVRALVEDQLQRNARVLS